MEVLAQETIRIRGARVHNLKNVSIEFPHNQLTVVTGVSGSGKSSLVFDTVYAEGQRRYVESLSAYARQFLERMEKPDVDSIDGIAPPIAIRQKNQTRNPRSTVATSTELYDFLRLLFARVGRTYCYNCGNLVERDTVDRIAEGMMTETAGSRWYVLFPVKVHEVKDKQLSETLRDHLFELRKKGFTRLFQDSKTFEFSTPESLLEIDFKRQVYVLVDRLAINADLHQRIVDSVEICYREAGEVIFQESTGDRQRTFNEKFSCKRCNIDYVDPEPTLFSFNSPNGACRRCQGFGNTVDYDLDLVIPDKTLPIDGGAIAAWSTPNYSWALGDFLKEFKGKVRMKVPVHELKPEELAVLTKAIREFFAEVETKKYKVHVRVFLSRYRGYSICLDCQGSRLRSEALNIRVSGKTMGDVCRQNIFEAYKFFGSLELSAAENVIASKLLVEVQQRLKFLNDVGLEYLTLDRLSMTLSGGEAQRIQLATCLGSRLVGSVYVLDEPSIGLHSRDTERLIRILEDLRDLGNTILVVEHDPDVMRSADHIVDMGPGAGERGGTVMFEGSYKAIIKPGNKSLTGRYLRGELEASVHLERRKFNAKRTVRFIGARANNLKGIDVELPLNLMVAVTGVSGSGKSTLVHDVIHKNLEKILKRDNPKETADNEFALEKVTCRRVERADLLTEVVLVDQSPIGRTPRSNPVTYVKAFDLIREIFARTPEAEKRGYNAGHFSFNIPGGRCETCQGDGTVTVEMQFLADVELICEECRGTRFKSSVLEVKYKMLDVHEVLKLTVREALSFFSDNARLTAKLKVLDDVGLGYLRLGQSATTLSGGEAQRVKLAAHLSQSNNKGMLYIFDEPTTGLHFDDISKLLAAFESLIRNGASLLVIEHNMDVIRAADWVIDLGPEGGGGGGNVVAVGTPEQLATVQGSYTGQFLAKVL